MKNLIAFTNPDDIHAYIQDLWRTDIFRENHKEGEGSYIHDLVEILSERPVIFFDMEDPSVEWSQFTTWMGAYALRPGYENDAVHDLYYMHEFWHGATMEYDGDLSFVEWHRKMCENEMLASVHSEAYVYFALENLREQSFDFEIWVDRFEKEEMLKGKTWQETEETYLLRYLSQERKKVMKTPDPFDFLEMQIHQYALQNMQWSNIWKDHYREVESHMASYLDQAKEDPEAAVQSHIEWLGRKQFTASGCVKWATPFYLQAEAFAEVVKANKRRWGNDILKSGN